MKKISQIILFLFFVTFTFSSCEDFLDVDSDRVVFVDEYQMRSANDTLYSMFGIFSKLQKLTDSYVLLGELRGDLMDVTDSAGIYLKEINGWNISANNPYTNNIKDYYAVINNCNYVINNIDTSAVKGGVKVMYKVYAASKAIRAWTYMQLALNYGKVIYYEKPILTLDEAKQSYPEYTMEQLAPILIADLEPWKDIPEPKLGVLYDHNTSDGYFPIRFLLGDLNLWLGAYYNDNLTYYEKAATEYHELMYKGYYINDRNYKSSYGVTGGVFNGNISVWNIIEAGNEKITDVASSNELNMNYSLDSLAINRMITPTSQALNNWASQVYVSNMVLDTLGDLRSILSVSKTFYRDVTDLDVVDKSNRYYVTKYMQLNYTGLASKNRSNVILVYRSALLYLRYAEAVNRLGKPNLAMATLKYGLNKVTMANKKYVPEIETGTAIPSYMDFTDVRFDNNMGVHMRGCGNVNLDTTYYRIPNFAASAQPKQDSIIYVEDLIEKELALETGFEGNRYHDLMRIAIRRNSETYLADKISAKYAPAQQAAIKNKLLQRTNWYLKY